MNSKTLLAILLMAPSCYATGHGGFENALEEGGRELAETGGQKIHNGDNAPKDKPWMVSFPGWCGGSLIAPDVVLTAAHCVDKGIYRVDWVIIGAWDLRRWDREDHGWEPERRTIQSFKVHPKYKDEEKNDIALVYLDKPSSLPPVNLGTSRPKVGANVKIMGWQGDDKILEEADIKVHKPSQCKEEKIDEDNEICAGRLDARQHTCAGDSGGPLFAKKNGEYEQLGLLNRGPWCPGTHDVYASVADHLSWIRKEAGISGSNPRPSPRPAPRPAPAPRPRDAVKYNPTYGPTPRPSKQPTSPPAPRPSKQPTSPPVKAPTYSPSKRPTYKPTKRKLNGAEWDDAEDVDQRLPACDDDATWTKAGKGSCNWVGAFSEMRCVVKGDDGRWAFEGCRATCDTCLEAECPAGGDSETWTHESAGEADDVDFKTCEWVADFSGNRCAQKGVDGTYAYQSCGPACRTCGLPESCGADDAAWYKASEPAKTCAWVGAATGVRCDALGADGKFAYEACPAACRACGGAFGECADDVDFFKKGDPAKGCEWIASATDAAVKAQRCLAKGEDAGYAFLACPVACGTC